MTVAPNPLIDLTTLDAVKAWLGSSANGSDDLLQRTITSVSRFIMTYCSRTFLPAPYSDRYDGAGSPGAQRVVLSQWPVISVSAVSLGNQAVTAAPLPGAGQSYGNGYLLSPGQAFPPGAQQWLDFFGWHLFRGSQNIGVAYRAGYANSESVTIPGSPYTFTPVCMLGSWRTDEGVTIAGVTGVKVAANPTAGQYAVSATGTYTFAAADAGKTATVVYGYIPQDLEQAALEMIAYRARAREWIGLVSKSLGGQETVTFSQKDLPDYIATSLQSYRRVF
jgi:hypothetical protein